MTSIFKNSSRFDYLKKKDVSECIRFGDLIPTISTNTHNFRKSDVVLKLKSILIKLFDLVPIWKKNHLFLHPFIAKHKETFRNIIKQIAYYYEDGPLRYSFIRLGYDTINNREASIHHIIIVKFRNNEVLSKVFKSMWDHIGKPTSSSGIIDLDTMKVTIIPLGNTNPVLLYGVPLKVLLFGIEINGNPSGLEVS